MSDGPRAAPSRRIRVLPPEVADQIAAGEVVERPASVVRELVDNALDAGARRILVEIEGAGSELIAVVDDGEGMSAEDAPIAFSRHATSKVSRAEDLLRIGTLGFRGEALASIAAVARVVLVTRRPSDPVATRVEVCWGALRAVRAEGAPVGTRVEVMDLFGNTPARRKFLKSPTTEAGHISDFVQRAALAWPQVSFTLRSGGRCVLEYPAVADPWERVRQVLGHERAAQMIPVSGRDRAGWVAGWITRSTATYPSQRYVHTYVNRRYVRDRVLVHGVIAGYRTLLMHGRYPAAVLFLDVPPEEVDVNVHPAKAEVRFRQSGAVHQLLARAVEAALRNETRAGVTAALGGPPPERVPVRPQAPDAPPRLRLFEIPEEHGGRGSPGIPVSDPRPEAAGGRNPFEPGEAGGSSRAEQAPRPAAAASADRPSGNQSRARFVGRVFGGYLICQAGDRLVLIDQHAAHERVVFERLRRAYDKGSVPRQQLLVPAVVELDPREAGVLRERLEQLAAAGLEVEPFGGSAFRVSAVPAVLGDADPAGLLREVVAELAEVGRSGRLGEAVESVLARIACHSAVRFGQELREEEVANLMADMERVDFAGHCPHGRPAYVSFLRRDLERWFRRT